MWKLRNNNRLSPSLWNDSSRPGNRGLRGMYEFMFFQHDTIRTPSALAVPNGDTMRQIHTELFHDDGLPREEKMKFFLHF